MRCYELNFTSLELQLIDSAWANGVLDWSSADLLPVRSKIRRLHRAIQNDRCCYCRKWFAEDHALAVDIEHILPKARYRSRAIMPVNLSVACKRCNMLIKRDKVDFVIGSLAFDSDDDVADSSRYTIIHPNVDLYSQHIAVTLVLLDDNTFARYTILRESAKGAATVDFFELRTLERDTLSEIQGLASSSSDERAISIRKMLGVA